MVLPAATTPDPLTTTTLVFLEMTPLAHLAVTTSDRPTTTPTGLAADPVAMIPTDLLTTIHMALRAVAVIPMARLAATPTDRLTTTTSGRPTRTPTALRAATT
jgi:hypothetical protein